MDDRYLISEENVMFVKLPKVIEEDSIEIILRIPKKAAGNYLKVISVSKNQASDIPIKTECSPSNCDKCGVIYCPVHLGYASFFEIKSKEESMPKEDNRQTIPGHPNCHYGDCGDNCHVMTCGIRLGFIPEPEPEAEPN